MKAEEREVSSTGTIFVTGAKGFIGRHTCRALVNRGYSVVGVGHGLWNELDYGQCGLVGWVNGDVSLPNLDYLARAHGYPAGIVHLAGGSVVGPSFAAPAEDLQRTMGASANVLEWIRTRGVDVPIVLASSAAVYGAGHSEAIDEDAVCQPYSPYGFHKRMAELLFESYSANFGVRTSIVRLFSVYGPGLRKQLLWDSCLRLAADSQILRLGGSGNEVRDWIHVEDAAELLVSCLDIAGHDCSVINGGLGHPVSIASVARRLCDSWGPGIEISFSGEGRRGDPQALVAGTGRLDDLKFIPRWTWESGVSQYVSWFKRRVEIGA